MLDDRLNDQTLFFTQNIGRKSVFELGPATLIRYVLLDEHV